jgi:hypothetical protein
VGDNRFKAMATDSEGTLYLAQVGSVTIMALDGKPRTQKLDVPDGHIYNAMTNILVDDVNGRLYGSNRNGSGGWYVWYWDLAAGGSFHGVLPGPENKDTGPLRGLNDTGPFKGTKLHCPGGISFGAHVDLHNPQRRWMFKGGGDNPTFFRLDLDKEIIDTFGPPDTKAPKPYKRLVFTHHKGKYQNDSISHWAGCPGIDEEGNMYLSVGHGCLLIRFRRVK